MTTEKSLIDQIKALSELEFAALFEEIKDYVYKENWDHIINEEDDGWRDQMVSKVHDLKNTIRLMEEEDENNSMRISSAYSALEDLSSQDCGVDYGNEKIRDVMDILKD